MQTILTPLRPRTSGRFASLMELYERNYMLVRLLAPRLQEMRAGEYVSDATGAMPLVLDRVEHGRYTTTFNLTYRFSSRHRHAREPDLSVRLYHDARTCEVMSGLLPGERHEPRRMRDLDGGWRLNRFLHRWLGYCLRQGHGFEAEGTGAPGVSDTAQTDVPVGARGDGVARREGGRTGSGGGPSIAGTASAGGGPDDGDALPEGAPLGDVPAQRQ